MSAPYLKLRDAHEENRSVTVTEADGTVHEDVLVEDYTRVVTETFEVWRFQLEGPDGDATVWGGRLESVEVLD